jgi:hypothetical protein
MSSSTNHLTPAFGELQEPMHVHFIELDVGKIADLVLDLYQSKHPTRDNAELGQWIGRLAIEMMSPHHSSDAAQPDGDSYAGSRVHSEHGSVNGADH